MYILIHGFTARRPANELVWSGQQKANLIEIFTTINYEECVCCIEYDVCGSTLCKLQYKYVSK